MVVKNFISVLTPIHIRSNYIGQCKHTPVVGILFEGELESTTVTVELSVKSDAKG